MYKIIIGESCTLDARQIRSDDRGGGRWWSRPQHEDARHAAARDGVAQVNGREGRTANGAAWGDADDRVDR
jgi:hypothetical protein